MPLSAFAAPLTFGGVVLTAFALFGYPPLQRAVGLKMTCSLGLLVGIPGDLLLPTAALAGSHKFIQQVHVLVALLSLARSLLTKPVPFMLNPPIRPLTKYSACLNY